MMTIDTFRCEHCFHLPVSICFTCRSHHFVKMLDTLPEDADSTTMYNYIFLNVAHSTNRVSWEVSLIGPAHQRHRWILFLVFAVMCDLFSWPMLPSSGSLDWSLKLRVDQRSGQHVGNLPPLVDGWKFFFSPCIRFEPLSHPHPDHSAITSLQVEVQS